MADNDQESARQPGASDQPSQDVSGSGDQPTSSISAEALARAFEDPNVQEVLDGLVERRVQSQKDRRFNKIERKQDDLESIVAEFKTWKDKNLSDEDALFRMKVDRFMSQQNEAPQSQTPGKPTPAASAEATSIAQALGLDENAPEVVKAIRENPEPLGQVLAMANLARSRQAQPNPAAVQSPGGGAVVSSSDELAKQYLTEKANIRRGSQAAEQLMALKTRFRERARQMGIEAAGPWS